MALFGTKQIRKFTVSIRVIPGKRGRGKRIKVFMPGMKG